MLVYILGVNWAQLIWGFLGSTSGKESACQCERRRRGRFNPWVRKIPWRRKWQPTPVFLPGKFHEPRRLVGYSPWGHRESDTTEQLHFHFSRLWFSAKSTHSELLSAAAIHGPEEKEGTKRRWWRCSPSIWWRCSVFCISSILPWHLQGYISYFTLSLH